jgi:hypothetical protein
MGSIAETTMRTVANPRRSTNGQRRRLLMTRRCGERYDLTPLDHPMNQRIAAIVAGTSWLLAVAVAGCAHQARLAENDPSRWPATLTDDETARMKQVAWDAANSQATVDRFAFERSTDAPMKLQKEGIHVYLDEDRRDNAEVAIPDASVVDFHAHYIGVTVARGSFEILAMRESFWP